MDTKLVEDVTKEYKKTKHPDLKVGDVVEVHTKIKEGDKERTQVFKGMIIAKKGSGVSKTITVRKISYGIGVEKIFPVYAPSIAKIKVVKHSKVRRSKLYYLRKRIGKEALKAGVQVPVEGDEMETQMEEKQTEDGEQKEESKSKGSKEEKEDSEQKAEESKGKGKSSKEEKEEGKEKSEDK